MNTCRVCKSSEGSLVKYSVRHYAHADCALTKWGAAFFDRLTPYQCRSQFLYMVAVKHGVADELVARAEKVAA